MNSEQEDDGLEEKFSLYDRNGRNYILNLYESRNTWVLKAFDDGILAAMATCMIYDKAVRLSDLHVFETATVPQGYFGLVRSIMRFPARKRNYQGRGIGTELLKFILTKCRARGFEMISGQLCQRDVVANPGLPGWYQRRGFQVAMNVDGRAGTIAFALGAS